LCSITFFFENGAVNEITWKNIESDRPQMTIRRMRIVCWTNKATDTHSKYVTHYFSTATMIARRRLSVTLYVQCLSCFKHCCNLYWTKYMSGKNTLWKFYRFTKRFNHGMAYSILIYVQLSREECDSCNSAWILQPHCFPVFIKLAFYATQEDCWHIANCLVLS